MFYLLRREWQLAREQAEVEMALSTEQGFPFWLAIGTIVQGGALAEQGQVEKGIAQMQQAQTTFRAMGAELTRIRFLPWLATAYAKAGQVEEGLSVLAEELDQVEKTKERWNEAELYRLKGMLTLQSQASLRQVPGKSKTSQKAKVKGQKSKIETSLQPLTPNTQEAEACFLKAIEIAQNSRRSR